MRCRYGVVAMHTWGTLPKELMTIWRSQQCDDTDPSSDDCNTTDMAQRRSGGTWMLCSEMRCLHKVVAGHSWGTLPEEKKPMWTEQNCDQTDPAQDDCKSIELARVSAAHTVLAAAPDSKALATEPVNPRGGSGLTGWRRRRREPWKAALKADNEYWQRLEKELAGKD